MFVEYLEQCLAVTVGDLDELRHERSERLSKRTATGRGEREAGVTVVAVDGRDDLGAPGRATGQLYGEVVGLATARSEHCARQLARRDPGETRRQIGLLLRTKQEVAVVEVIEGGVSGRDDSWISSSDVERTGRREAVEKASPVEIPDPRTTTLRLNYVQTGGVHDAHLLGVEVLGEIVEGSLFGDRIGNEIDVAGPFVGRRRASHALTIPPPATGRKTPRAKVPSFWRRASSVPARLLRLGKRSTLDVSSTSWTNHLRSFNFEVEILKAGSRT